HMFPAIDRVDEFAHLELHPIIGSMINGPFMCAIIEAFFYQIKAVLTWHD
ncbi:MAG: hypothetical protein K0R41_1983, partial [Geminicoccaceae bacterium]|nr:hypothetical protein [Geminicoccaceae bacterium]